MRVIEGDCRAVLADMPTDSIDAVVTDPPAGIAFMGREWDHDKGGRDHWIAWMTEIAAECLRVAKPGAHALVWALPRTSHWTATAWEDAGWEVRDRIAHLFGTGFPKSLNVSVAIDRAAGAVREVVGTRADYAARANKERVGVAWTGAEDGGFSHPETIGQITAPATPEAAQWSGWGTSLKPACEDWWLLRKPLGERTVAANVLRHGTGAINVDACRVPMQDYDPDAVQRQTNNAMFQGRGAGHEQQTYNAAGRWPANVVHDGSDEVEAAFAAFGESTSSGGSGPASQRWTGADGLQGFGFKPKQRANAGGLGDTGSASRFFYSAKATASDRADSKHPTVKPVSLLQWLVRLITPPGGTVLDPFAGSGTTAEAAMLEGFDAILIEKDPASVADIRHRMARWSGGDMPLFAPVPAPPEDARIADLFREPELAP